MDLVVDANILFAALIKDGITAKLLFLDDLHLYAPEFLLDEFNKHRNYLLNKTHRTKEDFNEISKKHGAGGCHHHDCIDIHE